MPGNNAVLQSIANDIGTANAQIAQAKELIEAAREAGESVGTMEADLRALEARKQKWENMLKANGYKIPGA